MSGVDIRLMRLAHGKDLPLPAYQSEHAAGLDLFAAVPSAGPVKVAPGAALSFRQDWQSHSRKVMKRRCDRVRASLPEMVSPSSTRPAQSTRTIGAGFRCCWSISATDRLLFPAACGLHSWLSRQLYALIL